MTTFPELQDELVDAARRCSARGPRAWRAARPVLVAAAAAAAVAAIVLLPGRTTTEEQPAPAVAKADPVERRYAVLRRPATSADALPRVGHFKRFWLFREDRRGFDPSRTRLAARVAPWSVYLVPATMGRLPSLCTVAIRDGASWGGGCVALALPRHGTVRRSVIAYPLGLTTEPGAFLFTVRDGIDALTLTFADRSAVEVPVRANVALYAYQPAPVRASWTGPSGKRHSQRLERPGGARHQAVGRRLPLTSGSLYRYSLYQYR